MLMISSDQKIRRHIQKGRAIRSQSFWTFLSRISFAAWIKSITTSERDQPVHRADPTKNRCEG